MYLLILVYLLCRPGHHFMNKVRIKQLFRIFGTCVWILFYSEERKNKKIYLKCTPITYLRHFNQSCPNKGHKQQFELLNRSFFVLTHLPLSHHVFILVVISPYCYKHVKLIAWHQLIDHDFKTCRGDKIFFFSLIILLFIFYERIANKKCNFFLLFAQLIGVFEECVIACWQAFDIDNCMIVW